MDLFGVKQAALESEIRQVKEMLRMERETRDKMRDLLDMTKVERGEL